MRRHAGQRALYEAMSRSKRKRRGLLESLRPQLAKLRQLRIGRPKMPAKRPEAAVEKPAPVTLKPPKSVELPEPVAPGRTTAWLRPKAVQFNAGNIEVSLPYQIGIIIGLGLTLLVMMAFWFGHRWGRIDERKRYPSDRQVQTAVDPGAGGSVNPDTAPTASGAVPSGQDDAAAAGATDGTGRSDHVIVLAQYSTRAQLDPVTDFFEEHGVTTSVVSFAQLRKYFAGKDHLNAGVLPQGDGYLLVSALCENPEKPGTSGYAVKQRIIEIGKLYKEARPPGYKSFAPAYFSDAYGMKVE